MLEASVFMGRELVRVPFNPYTFKFSEDKKTANISRFHQLHTKRPSKLKIILGNACNFRCEYCRQNEHLPYHQTSKEQLQVFVDHLAESLDLSNVETIEWWGGEPLVYWNEITALTEMISKHISKPFLHHMTTNGSLFNQDIVDYIKENKFQVKISHDGPSNFLRTKDVIEDKRTFRFIRDLYEAKVEQGHFLINSVLTKYCVSPQKIVDWFIERFDSRMSITKIEPVIPYNEWSKSFCCDLAGFKEFSKTLEHDLLQGSVARHVVEYSLLLQKTKGLLNDENWVYDATEAKCHSTQQSTIAVCLDGSVVPCQVYDSKSNAVLGKLGESLNERPPHTPADRWKRCHNCPVISLCRGTCPYIPDGEASDLNCMVRFLTYKAIFKAFVKLHSGMYVSKMDGDFKWNSLEW